MRDVPIAVPVKCSADPGQTPTFADTDEALRSAADVFERVKLLLAGRVQRMAWASQLEAANKACR